MIRVVFGSVGVRASVSRRIQFEKVLRILYAALNARLHLTLSSLTAGGMSLNAFEECLQRVPEFLSVSTLRMREERRREVMVEAKILIGSVKALLVPDESEVLIRE